MKRFYVLFAILLALNICVPPVTHAQDGDVGEVGGDQIGAAEAPEAIVIIDTHLASAIRATLGLAEDATLTDTDMLNLSSLQAKKAEISDLSGLEHATHLTTLNLYSNQLTDLGPLSGLEGLISLDVGKNEITDIEALKGLTALTSLHLDRNPITDFSSLSSLTGLSVLHLSGTGISDLSVLGSLTTLTQLYLTGNEIRDIGALSTLTELGWLFLAQNEISDVSPLVGMEALVSLRLLGNPVSNASVLYPLTQGSLIDVDIDIPPPADTEPPSVTIAVPADTQKGAFEVTITFTESVSDFEQSDLTVSGTATATVTAWTTTDDTVFTATITPMASGDVVVSVIADVAMDAVGNNNTASDSQTVTVDMDAPSVSISVPAGVQNTTFDVVITFTESVSGFEQADLSVSGTAAATVTAWSTTDEATYTATITPTTSGDVVVSVIADLATDAAGNNNTAADSQTVTVDMDAPSVSISVPAGVQNGAFDVVITFTESVSGFEQADVMLSGTATASITAWQTTDDTVWTATITPTTSGTLTLSIPADVAIDAVGNNNTAAQTQTVSVDMDAPSVSITVPSGAQNGAFEVTITFSEEVSGFEQADVLVSGTAIASITAWTSTDDTVWTATITPTTSGTLTLSIPADVAMDAVGNNNSAHTTGSVNIIMNVADDTEISEADVFVSVCDRTPQVRDAIVAALPNASDCEDVTAADLAGITSLNLSFQNITVLKANDFNGLTALEYLYLSNNGLSRLPDGIFDGLTELKYLNLWANGLSSLPDGIFDELTALKSLYLLHNNLRSLPAGIFDKLTVLKSLHLSYNDLSSLPEGIFDNLTALEYLYLGDNDLSRLQEDIFDGPTKLKYLSLSLNDLRSLPDGIFDGLTALEQLSLWGNELRSLPYGIFDGLTALEELYLSGNIVDPLPLTVSLEKIGEGEFKATAPTGAPFDIVLPLRLTHGSIDGGGTPSITISTGKVESESVTVTRTPGTADAVWVDIGTLPGLPKNNHSGYELVKSSDLPLTVIEGLGNAAPGIAAVMVLPGETTLSANYPNPFNPETWIPYQLANTSDVKITIYDGRGRVVRRLDFGHQPAGYYTRRSHAAYWDGKNNMGESVASGIYFYQFEADNTSLLRKMLILK